MDAEAEWKVLPDVRGGGNREPDVRDGVCRKQVAAWPFCASEEQSSFGQEFGFGGSSPMQRLGNRQHRLIFPQRGVVRTLPRHRTPTLHAPQAWVIAFPATLSC